MVCNIKRMYSDSSFKTKVSAMFMIILALYVNTHMAAQLKVQLRVKLKLFLFIVLSINLQRSSVKLCIFFSVTGIARHYAL